MVRFWTKVDRRAPDQCWPWLTAKDGCGYGMFAAGDRGAAKMVRSHRFVWELTNGPIPQGFCVLHYCDNPPCCNPNHLWLGTRAENNKDRDRKGRQRVPRGRDGVNAKLTEQQVHQIRALGKTGHSEHAIAARFPTSPSQVHRILHRESWAHLPELDAEGKQILGIKDEENAPF